MRNLAFCALALALAGATLVTTPAAAWWRGGVWVGVPIGVGVAPYPYPYPYPYSYPAPYPYYAPPAGYYYGAPAQTPVPGQPQTNAQPQGPVTYGATCYAGVYVCAAPAKTAVGQTCSCPGLGAPSYGTAG